MDAGTSFLKLVNTYEEGVYTSGTIIKWISGELTFCLFVAAHQLFVSDFTQRYLSIPQNKLLTTDPTPFLREWAKMTLASRSWRDALVTAVDVSISYHRLSLVA